MSLRDLIAAVAGTHAARATEEEKKARKKGEVVDDDEEEEEETARKAADEDKPEAMEDEEDLEASEEEDPEASEEEDEEYAPKSAREKAVARRSARIERARIGAILGHVAADKAPKLAVHLAFATAMPARQAVGLIKAAAPKEDRASAVRLRLAGSAVRLSPDAPKARVDEPAILALARARKGKGVLRG